MQQRFKLKGKGEILATGRAIGQKIGVGRVRIIEDASEMERVQPGDILVTDMTDPNWEPVMKRAAAIVTNRGGRTCHAAIIARELGIPAVVGCGDATRALKEGAEVTVSCAEGDTGNIYAGKLDIEVETVRQGVLPEIPVKIMMNVGNPQLAFDFQSLPNAGVGLARLEFIINNNIGVHPKAVLDYPNLDPELKRAVERLSAGYRSPRAFFEAKLAEGIATIGAAFWPKPVIVRMSDFKSNEYKKLIGGSRYEPDEENPMLGFRGAARYIAESFRECFRLEAAALKKVRNEMGLTNVEIMIPFVRTLAEAKGVTELLAAQRPEARRAPPDARRPAPDHDVRDAVQRRAGGRLPRLLRRVLDRLERPDPAHARPRPRLRASWPPASTSAIRRSRRCSPRRSRPAAGAASTSASAARARRITRTSRTG